MTERLSLLLSSSPCSTLLLDIAAVQRRSSSSLNDSKKVALVSFVRLCCWKTQIHPPTTEKDRGVERKTIGRTDSDRRTDNQVRQSRAVQGDGGSDKAGKEVPPGKRPWLEAPGELPLKCPSTIFATLLSSGKVWIDRRAKRGDQEQEESSPL